MRIAIACIVMALVTIAASSTPVFFDARLEPPARRVLSGVGETSAIISFEVALDSAIVATFLTHYREFAASHGYFIAQIGIDFHGSEHDVAIGMRDPDLYVLADGLRDVGRPVLLRIGNEFNHTGAVYQPSAYIGAFRHTTEVLQKDHLHFAAVWDATAQGFSDRHYMKWYPGDDVVDWWGMDISNVHDFGAAESRAFVDDAAHHRKPVIIDAAPHGVKSEAEALKWYASLFDFIHAHPAIKAFSLSAGDGPRVNATRRWPKAATYLKQQLADPRFIDAAEAPAIFRQPASQR